MRIDAIAKVMSDFSPLLNDNSVMEVVIRNSKGRIKEIQKILVSNVAETKEESLAQEVFNALNETTKMHTKNLQQLSNIAKIGNFGLILNGLNLCATIAGFAIMYEKLDKISAELSQQIAQLQKDVKQTQDLQNKFEFNKVLADYTDMLDRQRLQNPYDEKELRDLVDREYNMLDLLISTLKKDMSNDTENLILSIFSMLSMFTVSIRLYDEVYYFQNHEKVTDGKTWHPSHMKWMGIYRTLLETWFIEKIQDFAMFETNLTPFGVDIYYESLIEQVKDLQDEIETNQALVAALGDEAVFTQFQELSEKEIRNQIREAYMEAGKGMNEEIVMAEYDKAMKMVAA